MLNSHPDIEWQSELFHPLHEKTDSLVAFEDPYELLEAPLSRSNSYLFGFETKFQHLDENGLNVELGAYLVKLRSLGFENFILLERQNYLRQAISVARGQLTKTWHVAPGEKKPEFPAFELDLTKVSLGGHDREIIECFEFLEDSYQNATKVLSSEGIDFLKLSYEDDLESNAGVGLQRTLSFLGLRQIEPAVTLQKLDSRPVSEMISNWQEVFERLKGTRFEWMCEAGTEQKARV